MQKTHAHVRIQWYTTLCRCCLCSIWQTEPGRKDSTVGIPSRIAVRQYCMFDFHPFGNADVWRRSGLFDRTLVSNSIRVQRAPELHVSCWLMLQLREAKLVRRPRRAVIVDRSETMQRAMEIGQVLLYAHPVGVNELSVSIDFDWESTVIVAAAAATTSPKSKIEFSANIFNLLVNDQSATE